MSPTVNTELAAAIRRTNALRQQIPAAHRPAFDAEGWRWLERKIARTRSRDGALEAIAAWELDTRLSLAGALVNAPLEGGDTTVNVPLEEAA